MLAIRAAHLFDGVSAGLIHRPLVLVEQGKVLGLHEGEPPDGAELVDLGDVTLLPGLIDAHIHLCFDASDDVVGHLSTLDDDRLLGEMRVAARRALLAGITTVRDLGDRGYNAIRLREELAADPLAGPQVLTSGPPLTVVNGHCWYLGGEAEGVEGVRAAVREHARRGVDVIKVMATGGELTVGTTPYLPSFGVAELRAAADEAHAAGLPITAHAHGTPGIVNAIEAGFDMIEHCSFMSEEGATADDAVIAMLVQRNVTVVSTLGAQPGFPARPRIEALMPQLVEVFRRIREAGVTLVCASDSGINPAKPHDTLPWAAEMFVNTNGATPLQALRAMTSIAARACRVDDRKGRVAPGYDADLFAVQGNPLEDILALTRPAAVFRLGVRVR
jgi:imidazolonepropionase-like amidohydrolase